MTERSDVVVAAATPWGRSALAVVRATGVGCHAVVGSVVRPLGRAPLGVGRPRRVEVVDRDGSFDDGVVVLHSAPATYTGEDTAELTVHGNPLIVERVLAALVDAGSRLAEPGEFTRRAVLNGKTDLVRAEAILQVTSAASPRGLDVGRAGADGRLSAAFDGLRRDLIGAIAELEARLDYPGDDLSLVDDAAVLQLLRDTGAAATTLAGSYRVGHVLVHGARVALVGAVNAGKSSIFNALLGRRRAIVHETPGTTRDVLEVVCAVGGITTVLLDTAGERQTADPVEAAGLALARELVADADLLVVVLRARADGLSEVEREILERTADRPRVVVYNGVDAPGAAPPPAGAYPTVAVAGDGIAQLAGAIAAALVGEDRGGELVIASARQRDALLDIAGAVGEAIEALPIAGVAVAADALTRGVEALDRLTGADTREDVLDEVFARFCIGK